MVQNPLSDQNPAVTVGVGADTSGFSGAIDNAIAKMGGFRTATLAAGGALVALGTGAMVKATRQAMELETAFAEVSTLMGESANAAEVFGADVERLSTEFAAQGGQVEVVNGLYQTLSAGITDTTEATQLMEVAMKSATAGLSNTETAVDILTTVVNAYGLEASEATRVSDVLFETVRQGKTRYDELAGSVGQIVPISAELGVEFETVGAALATLTAQGQSTDQAVTAVRQAMVQLLRPQKDLLDLINDLGFETGRALVESEGFAGALRLLHEQAAEADVELGAAFGRVQAMQAVLPLAGRSAEDFTENQRLMAESTGATDTAFQKMSDTAQFRFRQALNELESSLAETGDQFLPFATKAAGAISTLIGDFNDLNQASGGAAGAIGTVGVALGGLALVAGGPVTLAIAGVGALAAAYATDFASIRSTVQRTMNDIAAIMDRTLIGMSDQTDAELGKQEDMWARWGDTIQDTVALDVARVLTVLTNKIDRISVGITNLTEETATLGEVAVLTSQKRFAEAAEVGRAQTERSGGRIEAFEQRAAARWERIQQMREAQDLDFTSARRRGRFGLGGEGALGGQTPLQQAIEQNRRQGTGAGGGGEPSGQTPTTTTAGRATGGGPSFQREATAEVARIWAGIEKGEVVTVDADLLNDLMARQGSATPQDLGLTPEEFTALREAMRGGTAATATSGGSTSGAASVTGVSTSGAVSTFDRAVTRFKDAVDALQDIEFTGRLVEKDGQIVAYVDERIQLHESQKTDRGFRYAPE